MKLLSMIVFASVISSAAFSADWERVYCECEGQCMGDYGIRASAWSEYVGHERARHECLVQLNSVCEEQENLPVRSETVTIQCRPASFDAK